MAKILQIITDTEWWGSYEAVSKCIDDEMDSSWDGVTSVVSLGDILNTGTRKQVGGKSLFKTRRQELIAADPSVRDLSLKEQLEMVFNLNPEEFVQTYGGAPQFAAESPAAIMAAEFIPHLTAITGNREFDYQLVFDLLAEKGVCSRVDYFDVLKSCSKITLYEMPRIETHEATGVLFIPYTPKPKEAREELEKWVAELHDVVKPERVVVLTHENPNPAKLGVDRKVKTQKLLDYALAEIAKFPVKSVCFCGHLDTESEAFEHKGVIVQPISSSQKVGYRTDIGTWGAYSITNLPR